jgi:hypothetical protein
LIRLFARNETVGAMITCVYIYAYGWILGESR